MKTMEDVKRKNKEAGAFFFSKSTMRFFHSVIETKLISEQYFITSERMYSDESKKFTVREVLPDGIIHDLSTFQEFSTRSEAKE